MNEEQEVSIPAGTLIHVGGMPFRLPHHTLAMGRSENLRLGLEALRGCDSTLAHETVPTPISRPLKAAKEVREVALALVDGNVNDVTVNILEIASGLHRAFA